MEEKKRKRRDNLIIFFISLFAILIVILQLLNGGFPATHDLNLHMTWLYEFDQGFREGHFLPRWSSNIWYGYGSPLFNYIQPLFYYLAEGFHLIGFSLVISVKLVIILSVILSFLFMYLLAKELWGKWPALVIAALYIYLPYRIGLLYIRGSFPEYLAMAFFPLLLFSFIKFLKTEKSGYFLLSSFTVALLILTHNIQTILFLPVLVIYLLVFYSREIKKILKSAMAIIYGALLSSFFWIPAFFERKYIQVERLATGRYDFHNSFVNLKQIFSPVWGGSDFYQIGAIGILIVIFTIYILIKRKKTDFNKKNLIFFFVLVIISLFLLTKPSTFIWESIPLLPFLQYPWRFLSLTVFGLAILGSVIVFPEFYRIFIKKEPTHKYFIILVLFIVVFSLTLFVIYDPAKPFIHIPARKDFQYNVYYQLFDEVNLVYDEENKFKNAEYNVYSGIPDVLPKGVDYDLAKKKINSLVSSAVATISEKGQPYYVDKLMLLSGEAKVLESKILTEEYQFNIEAEEESRVRINTFWFPIWRAYIDGNEVEIDRDNQLDLMDVTVPEGQHILRFEFHSTTLRIVAALVSSISFLLFLILSLILIIKLLVRKKYVSTEAV